MQIKQAVELYPTGVIKAFNVTRPPLSEDGWLLTLYLTSSFSGVEIETARGQPKVYKTFESLIQDFKRITGCFPKSMSLQL